eukprot:47849-Prymnesium_polylepis.1
MGAVLTATITQRVPRALLISQKAANYVFSRPYALAFCQRSSSAPIDIAAISPPVPQSRLRSRNETTARQRADLSTQEMALTSRVPVPRSERQLAHERRFACASCALLSGDASAARRYNV